MADSSEPRQPSETSVQENKKGLKYLDFVQVAAIYIVEISNPIPGLSITVVCKNAGKKTLGQDDFFCSASLVKQASSKALIVVHKVPEVALAVASEVQRAGVVDTTKSVSRTIYTKYEPTVKELYTRYEPVAEHYAVLAWHSLNWLPLFPPVAHIVIPMASYWSDKYNQVVCHSAQRGCAVATYLQLIPKEKIVKVFKEADSGPSVTTNGEAIAVSQ
ncbi:stress-related protein-like [Quercus lobata]|uniref:stress-related protein-like n=1 Tax=Quercus lobata TaxID=97700 RepID=UPI0012458BF1|nr:stress-related protein-like [Quercus lobata]